MVISLFNNIRKVPVSVYYGLDIIEYDFFPFYRLYPHKKVFDGSTQGLSNRKGFISPWEVAGPLERVVGSLVQTYGKYKFLQGEIFSFLCQLLNSYIKIHIF